MALDSPKLRELLKNVAAAKIQLPDFQREWKWDDERIKALMRRPAIFDGRNLYNPKHLRALGFHYEGIGRR